MWSRCLTSGLLAGLFLAVAGLAFPLGLTKSAALEETGLWRQFDPDSVISIDHTKWDTILGRYVVISEDNINRFRYGAVTPEHRALLESYIAELETIYVPGLNRAEQFAFWVNLYNAVTIRLILNHYPVKSIRDIKPGLFSIGPWKMKLTTVMGRELTLDMIEHDILRAQWQDPRVHYAASCASIGCPNLLNRAYRADTLEETLNANARGYINHPRGARIERGRLKVSSIYKWFREDFGGNEKGVIEHLKRYANEELDAQLDHVNSVSGYDYDWSLNETAATPALKSPPELPPGY